jgi:hypothetical protein
MAGTPGRTDNDGDYEAMIRRALVRGDGLGAIYASYRALRSASAKELRRRPGDMVLIGAHVSTHLLVISADLPGYRPWRPVGCAPVPRPGDALAAFDHALREARDARE